MTRHRAPEPAPTTFNRAGYAATTGALAAGLALLLWPQPSIGPPPLPVQAAVPAPTTVSNPAATPLGRPDRIILGRAVAGRDVEPGEYRTDGGHGCWWTRDADTAWATSGRSDGPIAVVLRDGAVFQTESCAPWRLVPRTDQ